jgi:hypothetical protein
MWRLHGSAPRPERIMSSCIIFTVKFRCPWYMLIINHLFALQAFGFLMTNTKITITKFNIFSPPRSSSILSLLFHIFFIHLISLPSSFSISLRSFLSLSLISLHPFHMCSIPLSLSPHTTFCTFFPLLPSIPIFSLLVPTSSLFFLFLRHTPLILPVVSRFFPFFLACLCLCPFHSALHSSIFLLLLIFLLFHWHTRFSDSISLSPSSLSFFFFSLEHSVNILTLPFVFER